MPKLTVEGFETVDVEEGKRLVREYAGTLGVDLCFQNFDQEIALPSGFQPERLSVEMRSNRKGVSPLTQAFPWTVDAG